MMSEQTFHKVQRLLEILCLIFTLLIALIFIPLCNNNESLEEKVQQNYTQLMMLNRNTPYEVGLDINTVQTNLNAIKPQIERLRHNYLCQIQMLALPKDVIEHLKHTFQTFEYILTRNELSNQLNATAGKKKITLDPSVLNNLPEYKYGITNQQSLWIKLAACQRTLESAFQAAPTSIQTFELLPQREYIRSITNSLAVKGKKATKTTTNIITREKLFIEIPIHIKFTGTMESVISFLRDFKGSLPRSEEEKIDKITNFSSTQNTTETIVTTNLTEEPTTVATNITETTNAPAATTNQPPAQAEQKQQPAAKPADKTASTNAAPAAAPAKEAQADKKTLSAGGAPSGQKGNGGKGKPPAGGDKGAKPTPTPTPEDPAPKAAAPAAAAPAIKATNNIPADAKAPAVEEKPAEPDPVFKNSIFLGAFEIYVAPDNPDHVVFDGIIHVIYRTPTTEVHK